ncbi:hypothetical protein F2Q70_00008086, partial [Brassica cretica]
LPDSIDRCNRLSSSCKFQSKKPLRASVVCDSFIGDRCSQGNVDCNPIKPGGPWFEPNTLRNHASFVMNEYYQSNGRTDEACYFNDTSMYIITVYRSKLW